MPNYLGRAVGVGALPDERDFIAYAVSGRSEPSRARVARIISDKFITRVNIGPIDPNNLTDEQKAQAQWIHYDGMLVSDLPDYLGHIGDIFVLATNGEQTTAIYNLSQDSKLDLGGRNMVQVAMKVLGPEREKYSTPRIAGFLRGPNWPAHLSIVTTEGYFCSDVVLKHGEDMKCVSTYVGAPADNEVVVPKGNVSVPMFTIPIHGNTAQELADNLFDFIPKEIVVCTVVALRDHDFRFDVAVRNFHTPM